VKLRLSPTPFCAPRPLPQRTNARCRPPAGASNNHRSDGPLLHPGKIDGGGVPVLQGSGWLSSTPAQRPPHPQRRPLLPRRPSSHHLDGHGGPRPQSPIIASEPSLVLMGLMRRSSLSAPTPMAEINRPRLPLTNVANVCFQVFQSFQRYVAKVDRGMLHMLQVFSEACSKRLFKMFYLFTDVYYNRFLSGCCICFHTYVATVCSKYFSCFSLMLQ